MLDHKSQLFQDVFALTTAKNKFYIEIGAWDPVKYNNSFILERNGWQGFSLEIDKDHKEQLWLSSDRLNKIYWTNALTFDYKKAVTENQMPSHLGYLSCDIEPPQNTFSALQRVIEAGLSFDCITFEHDKYLSEMDYDKIATDYLTSLGYKIAVKDVYRTRRTRVPNQKKKDVKKCFMETWYVHESIDFPTITFDEWLKKLVFK